MEAKVRAWDPFRGLKQPLIEKKENEEEEDGARYGHLNMQIQHNMNI